MMTSQEISGIHCNICSHSVKLINLLFSNAIFVQDQLDQFYGTRDNTISSLHLYVNPHANHFLTQMVLVSYSQRWRISRGGSVPQHCSWCTRGSCQAQDVLLCYHLLLTVLFFSGAYSMFLIERYVRKIDLLKS